MALTSVSSISSLCIQMTYGYSGKRSISSRSAKLNRQMMRVNPSSRTTRLAAYAPVPRIYSLEVMMVLCESYPRVSRFCEPFKHTILGL